MTDDLISRKLAINELWKALYEYEDKTEKQFIESDELDVEDWIQHRNFVQNMNDIDRQTIFNLPVAQLEQRWVPLKTRPMTEEERQYYSEMYGYDVEYEEAVMFDCKMPEDGQEIWVCSKCGNVWQDICVVDEGIGLEGNGDWLDIVAWMPFEKPEPWKGEDNEM